MINEFTLRVIPLWDTTLVKRGTAVSMTKEGPILMHPLDLFTLEHGSNPVKHVQVAVQWLLEEAQWKMDQVLA